MEHNQTDVCKLEFANLKERISKLEEKTAGIERMDFQLQQLTASVNDLIVEIKQLISKPAKRWETVISSFISTAVGLAVGYFITKR